MMFRDAPKLTFLAKAEQNETLGEGRIPNTVFRIPPPPLFPLSILPFFFFLQLHKLNGKNVFYTVFPAFQIKNQLQNNNLKIFT